MSGENSGKNEEQLAEGTLMSHMLELRNRLMKAVLALFLTFIPFAMFANDLLKSESVDIVVAGGMESMTNAPYLLPKARAGLRMGHSQVIDHMFYDGLEDAYDKGRLMGTFYYSGTADHCNFDMNYSSCKDHGVFKMSRVSCCR